MARDEYIEVECPDCDFPYTVSVKELRENPELYCRFCEKSFPVVLTPRPNWNGLDGRPKGFNQRSDDD